MNEKEKVKYIITHAGDAHRDDLLSVAFALAHFGIMPVLRRDPTEKELEDLQVLVLDAGGRLEPEKLNFDHHQFQRDALPECTLSLLSRHFGWEADLSLQPWWEFTKVCDARGPLATAASLGMQKLPKELFSPVEGSLLRLFSQSSHWELDTGFLQVLRDLGRSLLDSAQEFAVTYSRIAKMTKVKEVGGIECFIVNETLTGPLVGALAKYREISHPRVAVSVTFSDRDDESWSLYRYEDHTLVDFSRIAGHSKVRFAHANGFLAKLVEGVNEDEALEFVRAALGKKYDRNPDFPDEWIPDL